MSKGFYWKLAMGNIVKNRRIYFPYLLSSTGIAILFYSILALQNGIDEEALYGGSSVLAMMALGSIVIGFLAVLFLFYTNSFMMKHRKKELGLYNILGMEKRHIARILFRETLICAGITIVLGLLLGILFSRLMFLALGKLLALSTAIAFVIPGSALLATTILLLAIYFMTMLYNILQVRLAKPIELLHGGETGEKEPKAHWLLAVLGFLALGAGYYIAVSITSPLDALLFFFVAVILVIFGTYLLFITGITALLKILKKNKKFYYQTRHFTTVSGMLYRMKQNAAGLASICILFTALLVTVSTTFSLYTSTEDLVHSRYPNDISIRCSNPNLVTQEAIDSLVREESEKTGIAIENPSESSYRILTAGRRGNEFVYEEEAGLSYGIISFMTVSEYNRIYGASLALEERQLFISDPDNHLEGYDKLLLDGEEYAFIREEFPDAEPSTSVTIYEGYTIVVPEDAPVLAYLEAIDVPLQYRYAFDVDGSDREINLLQAAISSRFEAGSLAEGGEYDSLYMESAAYATEDFYSLYGGLFFIGLFLGFLFLMGTAMIIYYKQVSEGYEDARRFGIMKKVGMSHRETTKSIHSQILLVFFLPLITAVIHLAFAFPMLEKILMMMGMENFQIILLSTLGCVAVFAVAYAIIYAITARTYTKIVESAGE